MSRCGPLVILLALSACRVFVVVPDSDEDPVDTGDTVVPVTDDDDDGFPAEVDCDDANDAVHPGATEVCNGVDDDCVGGVDDDPSDGTTWFRDADADDFGTDETQVTCAATAPTGWAAVAGDCDDDDDDVNPDAAEVCNGIDDDCDGASDLDDDDLTGTAIYSFDGDGDGFGAIGSTVVACAPPSADWITTGGDCDDGDDTTHPGARPRCDGGDHDCADGPDVDLDLDDDGAIDYRCGGTDCDDDDDANVPVNGVCSHGLTCLDVLNSGIGDRDGLYYLDLDGPLGTMPPIAHQCRMESLGGGFTLIAVNGPEATWNEAAMLSATAFGSPQPFADYKADAYRIVGVTDVLFTEPLGMLAYYEAVGDGTKSMRQLVDDIPDHNCGLGTAQEDPPREWVMTEGNLFHNDLCSTHLYINVADYDGGACDPDDDAVGPAWSVNNNSGCPIDDPDESSFVDHRNGPWTKPVSLWVR